MKNFYYRIFIIAAFLMPTPLCFNATAPTQQNQSLLSQCLALGLGVAACGLAAKKWQNYKEFEKQRELEALRKLEELRKKRELREQEEAKKREELHKLEEVRKQKLEALRILEEQQKKEELLKQIEKEKQAKRKQKLNEKLKESEKNRKKETIQQEKKHNEWQNALNLQYELRQQRWKREAPKNQAAHHAWQETGIKSLAEHLTPRAVSHQLKENENKALIKILQAKNWGEDYVKEQLKAMKKIQEKVLSILQTPLPTTFQPKRDKLPQVLIHYFEESLKKADIDPKYVDYVFDTSVSTPLVQLRSTTETLTSGPHGKPIITNLPKFHYSLQFNPSDINFFSNNPQEARNIGLHEAQHIIQGHLIAGLIANYKSDDLPSQLKNDFTGLQELTADTFAAIYHKDIADYQLNLYTTPPKKYTFALEEDHPDKAASAKAFYTILRAHENVKHLKNLGQHSTFFAKNKTQQNPFKEFLGENVLPLNRSHPSAITKPTLKRPSTAPRKK